MRIQFPAIACLSLSLLFCHSLTAKAANPNHQLPAGTWTTKAWDGELIEHWQHLQAGVLESQAIYIEKGDTLYRSTSRMEQVMGEWVLFSIIEGNNPKIFRQSAIDDQSITFVNSDYSNPQEVRYSFIDEQHFERTISGEENGQTSTYTFSFTRTTPSITANTAEALQRAFAPLVDRSWRAEGQWENGPVFKQETRFSVALQGGAIIAQSDGFIDQEQTQWGQRNHGIRYFDTNSKKLLFVEYDVFGGATKGEIEIKGDDIFYHYDYDGTPLTDAWEKMDQDTYNFTVGTRVDDAWNAVFLRTQFVAQAQNETIVMKSNPALPYRQIPDYPEKYNACTVAARMIDGLGFRYYWATEGLRQNDLDYRTTPESRSSGETIDHIYGLAQMVHNAVMEKANVRPAEEEELSYAEKRAQTLALLKAASDKLKISKPKDMKRFDIVFQRGDQRSSFPFWNSLNGPLADAMWHVGQVVAFRRASGNPFNNKVSVFSGTVRD